MKHDAIYARYSSHAQDDGTSIEVQLEQCERAAGGTCRHYIDRAKTGRTMSGRAQLLAMLADAEAGKLKRIFVYKFDRFGRDAETHTIVRDLEEHGAEVVSATEGANALARGIQLVVAEDYSRQLAMRTRDGLVKRFEQRTFTGGVACYGYRVVTRAGQRVLEVEPTEAAIVRDVTNWYLSEAIGFKGIAKRLRARGVTSRKGAGWTFTSIRSLLLNPILAGRVRFNVRKMQLDRRTGRRLPRAHVASEQMERQDEALRILSDETLQKIHARLAKSARGQSPRAPRGISRFTGLIFCGCGCKTYRVHSDNGRGVYDTYVCARHLRYDDCEKKGRVREDEVLAMVKGRFERIFTHSDEIIARAIEVATEAIKGNREAADRLKGEIASIEADQARHVELLMDRKIGEVAKREVSKAMADADARRLELQRSLDGLRDDANQNTEVLAAMVRKVFDEARENLAAAVTPEAFNRFVERFVGPLEIQADGTVKQKKTPPALAGGGLIRPIAGGGFEPPTSGLLAFSAQKP
jgi:site-specific DNA recombinase